MFTFSWYGIQEDSKVFNLETELWVGWMVSNPWFILMLTSIYNYDNLSYKSWMLWTKFWMNSFSSLLLQGRSASLDNLCRSLVYFYALVISLISGLAFCFATSTIGLWVLFFFFFLDQSNWISIWIYHPQLTCPFCGSDLKWITMHSWLKFSSYFRVW